MAFLVQKSTYLCLILTSLSLETNHKIDVKSDPSGIHQSFSAIGLKIHCCRYWKLAEWELNNLLFPFWRLYHNHLPGAMVIFADKKYELENDHVCLIPPKTSFSTRLKKNGTESLKGSRITSDDSLDELRARGMVDHLFIHFNLGFHPDQLIPGIYQIKADDDTLLLIDAIKAATIIDNSRFGQSISLRLHELIFRLVNKIPVRQWKNRKLDARIMKVMDYIEMHMDEKISNEKLADLTALASNSLLRLFKQHTGNTVQQYIQQKRIEKAVLLMHHHTISIDQLAERCGFSDRQHFSKVFKRISGISPAAYRRLHSASDA